MFAAHEVLHWFRVIHFYITIQSNQSNCNSIKRSCAAGCQHRFYKCMYVWINSSNCCTIGTNARPNLAPKRFTTAVRTFALWWHSKRKYISHFIAETSIAETAAPNCPISPGSYVACILAFTILLVSVDCCVFAFFGVFSGDFGFLHSRSIPDMLLFLKYFLSFSQWAPFSYVSPWLKPLVTSLHLIKARLYCR